MTVEWAVERTPAQPVKLFKVQGATESTLHSINEEEQEQFCIHINQALKNDVDVGSVLPIDPYAFNDLYDKCKDGLVLR